MQTGSLESINPRMEPEPEREQCRCESALWAPSAGTRRGRLLLLLWVFGVSSCFFFWLALAVSINSLGEDGGVGRKASSFDVRRTVSLILGRTTKVNTGVISVFEKFNMINQPIRVEVPLKHINQMKRLNRQMWESNLRWKFQFFAWWLEESRVLSALLELAVKTSHLTVTIHI